MTDGAGADWRRFVAIGDSFTEGVGDELPDGACRGWADLVAGALAAGAPDPSGFGYANLAVRGKLLGAIIDDQLDAGLALQPDLVTFVAGGNDLLRPAAPIEVLVRQLDLAVARLADSGADVVMFTGADPLGHIPLGRLVRGQAMRFCDGVRAVARRRGATLVDLFPDADLAAAPYWSDDLLHLNSAGHRQVAARTLDALGVARPAAWSAGEGRARGAELVGSATPSGAAEPVGSGAHVGSAGPAGRGAHVGSAGPAGRGAPAGRGRHVGSGAPADSAAGVRSGDSARSSVQDRIRYYRRHVAPWIGRRLTGRSSGDGRSAKRPSLQPVSPIFATAT